MNWFYYFGRFLMRILLAFLTRWEVKGKENVPPSGPLIIAANHRHAADAPLLAVSIPRKMIFMAKEELFRSALGDYFVRGFGAFPVSRSNGALGAVRQAIDLLQRDYVLAMFPEGTRSKNGQMGQAYPGLAFLAQKTAAPILPVGISGTDKLDEKGWMFRRPRISVTIGFPFSLPSANGKRNGRETSTAFIIEKIARLLPPENRGTGHVRDHFGATERVDVDQAEDRVGD